MLDQAGVVPCPRQVLQHLHLRAGVVSCPRQDFSKRVQRLHGMPLASSPSYRTSMFVAHQRRLLRRSLYLLSSLSPPGLSLVHSPG